MKRGHKNTGEMRELTDKELKAIGHAMGCGVRSQSDAISKIVQTNLRAAFADRRQQAVRLLKLKKTIAA